MLNLQKQVDYKQAINFACFFYKKTRKWTEMSFSNLTLCNIMMRWKGWDAIEYYQAKYGQCNNISFD